MSVARSHLNRGIMVVDEVVLDILKSECGLAYSAVTEHHNAVPGIWRNVDNMTIKLMLIIVKGMINKSSIYLRRLPELPAGPDMIC